MEDSEIIARISELVEEEHRLEGGSPSGLTTEEQERQRAIEVSLDQCWDLLAQRRARRNAGENPDEARVRPASVVEHYEQ